MFVDRLSLGAGARNSGDSRGGVAGHVLPSQGLSHRPSGWAETGPGRGPRGELGLGDPWLGRAGPWGGGDQPLPGQGLLALGV